MTSGAGYLSFIFVSLVILVAGIMVVSLRNLIYSALALILCFSGIAGLYLQLKAEFVAGVQVLIYVGAVAVLILFVIMLTPDLVKAKTQPELGKRLVNIAGMFFLFVVMGGILIWSTWNSGCPQAALGVKELGRGLFSTYLLPFEILSLVLLAALIGSLVLARKEEEK